MSSMQDDFGLTLQHLRRRMRAVHSDSEVLTNQAEGIERATFGESATLTRPGATLDVADLRAHLERLVPKWWLPDEFVSVPEVPKTSVGKFDKKKLRAELAAGGSGEPRLP